jgi:hypothetical protein
MSGPFPWGQLGALSPVVTRISSRTSIRGWCPGWSANLEKPDIGIVIDSALPRPHRDRVRVQRATLIAHLEASSRLIPGDVFVVGQRVRMLIDQGEASAAVQVARSCRAEPWWCDMLVGYASARSNDLVGAAQALDRVDSSLPFAARCLWRNVGPLLDTVGRRAYEALPCDRQDEYTERFWWLSDPLWSDSINHRKVEHAVRRVRILLNSALERDEFFSWTPSLGGDAAREMLVRYGWPAFMLYDPIVQRTGDREMSDAGLPSSGPYVMPAYHRSRISTAPTWSALQAPASSRRSDWTLHEPDTNDVAADPNVPASKDSDQGFQRLRLERERLALVWPHSVVWWPSSHFDPPRPIVSIDELQLAQLRRQDGVLVAMATTAYDPLAHEDANLGYSPASTRRRRTDSLRVSIVGGLDAMTTRVLASSVASIGTKTVLEATLPSGQYVLGVEIRSLSPGGADSRTRFGFTTARPLSELSPPELAISDPIVLERTGDITTPSDAQDVSTLLQMMRPSLVLHRSRPVDLFWEVYGAGSSDTLDVEVRLIKDGRTGALYQLRRTLGLVNSTADSISMRWRTGRAAPAGNLPPRATEIGVGQLRLNLSQQSAGWYTIETSVSQGPGRRAVGRRRIRVVE